MEITKAQQALDILQPIPAEKWCRDKYITADGTQSCALGHIHLTADPSDAFGDLDGFGLRHLSRIYLQETHEVLADITSVNNNPEVNGYTESDVKDRVIHLLHDMVAAGY